MRKLTRRQAVSSAIAPLSLLWLPRVAVGNDWPPRTVRVVVPFAAGGTTDIAARVVTQELAQATGQTFLVENRVGASGMIGSEHVARSKPDGSVLLMGSSSTIGSTKFLYSRLPYDPVKDFQPVALVANSQACLLVNATLPVTSVPELIQYIKQNPAKVNYGSAGVGTYHHLAGAMFASMAGADMMHVPYQGGGPAFAALLAGQIQVMISTTSEVGAQLDSDKIRVLAKTGPEPFPGRPNLPAIAAFLPGFRVPLWVGLLAPAGTPPHIVQLANAAVLKALSAEPVKKRLLELGFTSSSTSPEDYANIIKSDLERWPMIVKISGAKLD